MKKYEILSSFNSLLEILKKKKCQSDDFFKIFGKELLIKSRYMWRWCTRTFHVDWQLIEKKTIFFSFLYLCFGTAKHVLFETKIYGWSTWLMNIQGLLINIMKVENGKYCELLKRDLCLLCVLQIQTICSQVSTTVCFLMPMNYEVYTLKSQAFF